LTKIKLKYLNTFDHMPGFHVHKLSQLEVLCGFNFSSHLLEGIAFGENKIK
jgi:hypothetical protein